MMRGARTYAVSQPLFDPEVTAKMSRIMPPEMGKYLARVSQEATDW